MANPRYHRRESDPEDAEYPDRGRDNDGLRIPVAISGITLLAVVFGGGGLWVRDQNQTEDLKELRIELADSRKSQVSGERIARCEAAIEQLRSEDTEIKENIRSLWRRRNGDNG